jgi:L-lactate dehydrogenase complex protein LldG
MSDGRTAMLARIEGALRTARIPSPTSAGDRNQRAAGAAAEDPHRLPVISAADNRDRHPASPPPAPMSCGDRFILEARALGVEVFVEWTAEAVRERVRALTAGARVLAWNDDKLPYKAASSLPGMMLASAPPSEQARADVGVTGCHGAIAETGSLALISGPGCSRTVSLLPPVHVALVRRADLFATMGEFLEARREALDAAANCTFVTGPSRTADIELSLTIGVHGPGRVVVVLGP